MKQFSLMRTVVIPIVVAALAVVLVNAYLHLQAAQRATAVPTSPVVVVTAAVGAQTILTPAMLKAEAMPDGYLPPSAVSSVAAAVGKVTTVGLVPGDVLMSADLASAGPEDALSYALPNGQEAFTVPVTESSGVNGFIEPGDRVDILAYFSSGNQSAGVSGLVASEIPVLAVEQSRTPQAQPTPTKSLTSVTLEVTAAEGSAIFYAEQKGTISLMLRGATDRKAPAQVYATQQNVFQGGAK